jgi:hypothetical protein
VRTFAERCRQISSGGLYQSAAYYLTTTVFYDGARLLRDSVLTADDVVKVTSLVLFSMDTAVMMMSSIPQVAAAKIDAAHVLHFVTLP